MESLAIGAEREQLFGTIVIAYLFLGGATAGSLLITCVWSISFYRSRTSESERDVLAFKTLRGRCYLASFMLLAFSILCLLWDLGSPERALLLLTRPHLSVLSVGAFALSAEALVAGALVVSDYYNPQAIDGRVRKALEYACAVLSVAVMIYTGVFLAANDSVPFWATWTLVALFFFSSFSSGNAVVMLLDYFNPDEARRANAIRPSSMTHIACLVLEAAFLAAFLAHAFDTPGASGSVAILLQPSVLRTGIIGVGIMGIALPFAGEAFALAHSGEERRIPFCDFACLAGGLLLRYCIVVCGVH